MGPDHGCNFPAAAASGCCATVATICEDFFPEDGPILRTNLPGHAQNLPCVSSAATNDFEQAQLRSASAENRRSAGRFVLDFCEYKKVALRLLASLQRTFCTFLARPARARSALRQDARVFSVVGVPTKQLPARLPG